MIQTAVILAAGRGVRMGPAGEEIPKGFIAIDGEALVRRSLREIFRAGVARAVIVTGHLHHFYDRLAAEDPGRIACRYNPGYAQLGSLESLRLGLCATDAPALVLESDLIYEGRVIDALCARDGRSTVLVTAASGSGDEVYVWGAPWPEAAPRFEAAHKDRAFVQRAPLGEYPGMLVIGAEVRRRILACAPALLAASPMADYEIALMAAARETPVECFLMPDLVWAEIDDARMLRRVIDEVQPRLAERERRREALLR